MFHYKLRNQGYSFTRDKSVLYIPVAFRTPPPTLSLSLSLASEQTLKDARDPIVEVRRVDLANWALH